tara:strand:- start:1340 stop:2422 length:1083 start_codon:yes stop_codon:yes gene_type:complete
MFVADLHNDLVQRVIEGENVTKFTPHGHTDIPRLLESKIDLEILIIWVSSKSSDPKFFERANKMYDEIEKISSNEQIVIPKNFTDIREGINESKLMLPIAMEGGEGIENDINNLFHFIEKGLLYFGPTWNHSLDWVSSNYDETYNSSNLKSYGLNQFGKEVINVCQENKVLIDVSHIGEKSFWDIAKISSKPIIASHSSVYNLCPHFRNLKDDQIEEIKKSKGLIGLNPYPFFIDKSFKERENKERKKYSDDLNSIERKYSNKISQWIAKQHFLQKKLADICPSIEIFVDHIEYVINKIGIDYVGIGSDYDGLDCLPNKWNDCLDHMIIQESLENRGYKNSEIEKIMGKNILRVLEEIHN